jgi:hypothetical protein
LKKLYLPKLLDCLIRVLPLGGSTARLSEKMLNGGTLDGACIIGCESQNIENGTDLGGLAAEIKF